MGALESQIWSRLFQFSPYRRILSLNVPIRHKTRVYVVGGAIRDILIGLNNFPKDLDLVTYLGRHEIGEVFSPLGKAESNRYGNFRFRLGKENFPIDIWNPKDFWGSQKSVEKMLAFFYISVNAIAFDISSEEIIDPVGGMDDITKKRLRILPNGWHPLSDENKGVLFLKVLSIISRSRFSIVNPNELSKFVPCIQKVPRERLNKYQLSFEQFGQLSKDDSLTRIIGSLKELGLIKKL